MKISITTPPRIATLCLLFLWINLLSAKNDRLPASLQDTIPKTAAGAVEFLLQGVARNGDTGEKFDHIYVDVYKILPDGSVEVVRTDRFPGGEFEVWLHRDERYMLMMNYNNTAFLEGLLNPADAEIIDGVLSQIFILDEYRPDLLSEGAAEEQAEEDALWTNGLIADQNPSPDPLYTAFHEDALKTAEPASKEATETATTETLAADADRASNIEADIDSQDATPMGIFYLNGSTSFRSEATHLSEPLLRFSTGDAVELLEKTDQYWWKVRFKEKIGWVKAAKLQEKAL